MAEKSESATAVPARRFTDAGEKCSTVVARGISIRGELTGEDSVEIAGTIDGGAHVAALCVLREGARVNGTIEAKSLVVAGEVRAPKLVAEKIEIRAGADVRADLYARVVAIAEGARFDGAVQMGSSDSPEPTRFRERRAQDGSETTTR